MRAAARLDPARGVIAGYADAGRGRPERVEMTLDGTPAAAFVAGSAGAELLGLPDLLAEMPAGGCGFAVRVPRRARARAPVELALRFGEGGAAFFAHRFETTRELELFTEGCRLQTRFTVEIDGLELGTLRGRLTCHGGAMAAPELTVRSAGRELAPLVFDPGTEADGHRFRAELPAAALDEGVQTLEIAPPGGGEVLARYPIVAGRVLAGDVLAEIAALRAEIDELRSAIFAAFAEPALPASERPLMLAELMAHVEAVLGAQDARVSAEIAAILPPAGSDGDTPAPGDPAA